MAFELPTGDVRYNYWGGTMADDATALGTKFNNTFGYDPGAAVMQSAYGGGAVSIDPNLVPSGWGSGWTTNGDQPSTNDTGAGDNSTPTGKRHEH